MSHATEELEKSIIKQNRRWKTMKKQPKEMKRDTAKKTDGEILQKKNKLGATRD